MEAITIIASIAGLNVAMGWYLHTDIRRVEARVDKLDDRLYAFATSMKPLIEEAENRRRFK